MNALPASRYSETAVRPQQQQQQQQHTHTHCGTHQQQQQQQHSRLFHRKLDKEVYCFKVIGKF